MPYCFQLFPSPFSCENLRVEQESLIGRCLAGEAAAFRQMHDEQAGRVVAYFLRSGFSPADADDLRQEVFLRAFKSLRSFDDLRGSLGGWLAAIARNVARRHWQQSSMDGQFDAELAEETLRDPAGPPDLTAQEEIEALKGCIDKLPAEFARLVSLRYVDGLTTRGVAARIGWPEATVRLRLAEAKEMLTECLKKKGIFA